MVRPRLRRRLASSVEEASPDMNITPLIDVMLVLLVILIITIPLQTHSVKLDMPSPAASPPPPPARSVVIGVAEDGALSWDGAALPDRTALEVRLQGVAAASDPVEVHVRPAPLAPYGAVAEVLSAAQRLGVTRLGIVERDGGT